MGKTKFSSQELILFRYSALLLTLLPEHLFLVNCRRLLLIYKATINDLLTIKKLVKLVIAYKGC